MHQQTQLLYVITQAMCGVALTPVNHEIVLNHTRVSQQLFAFFGQQPTLRRKKSCEN